MIEFIEVLQINNFIPIILLMHFFVSEIVLATVADNENYAEIGIPITEVFDPGVHKGANQNWWLVQAENGLIYNGTGTGLNEWDGEQWHMYYTPNKKRIRSLSIWKDQKIYIGTSNDIGFYSANHNGSLVYQSLLTDWKPDEKQFGEVWSTAATTHGVLFLSSQYLLFWDGSKVKKITDAAVGSHRIFSVDDVFYYKSKDDEFLYSITISPQLQVIKTDVKFLKSTSIRKILKNRKGNLTFVTAKNGIYEMIDGHLEQQTKPADFTESVNVFNAIQARDGFYYIATLYHGLYIVDEDFIVVKHYTEAQGLGTNTLLSILEDQQNTIWISSDPNIIKMIPPHVYSHYDTEINLKTIERMSMPNGKLTIVGDSIFQLEKFAKHLGSPYFKNLNTERLRTWDAISYQNHLFFSGAGGLYAFSLDENNIPINQEKIFSTPFAKGLAIDKNTDTLFVASEEGLFRVTYVEKQWKIKKITNTNNYYIAIDKGIVWVGTETQTLYRIENAQYDDKETIITKFDGADGIGSNNVIPFKLSSGIVIGTNDGLMEYLPNQQKPLHIISKYPKIFRTNGQDVYRIYEDGNKIWYRIGNQSGYIEQDDNGNWQAHEELFKHFASIGFKGFVKTADHILMIALSNGEVIRLNTNRAENIPVSGQLNIRKIINLDNDAEIYGGIGRLNLSDLNQQNNSIRISFALVDNSMMKTSNPSQYRHRLIGSGNNKFSKWSTDNHKDYTLLRGGGYQFELESKDGRDRISSKQFNFTILPVWYLSTTAWIVYSLIALLLLILTAWISQKWRAKQLILKNKQLEQQVEQRTVDLLAKSQELEQQQVLKDRFFTNVSHEFRTPLTLTIAPLESLVSDFPEMDNALLHPIEMALKNSKKMLSLVGQVLDINRLESKQFPLRVAQYNISELINNTAARFMPWSKQHQQILSCLNTQETILLYFDQDQIEKCLSNLIANAIKYSGEKSHIVVSIVHAETHIGIKVEDDGPGISQSFENKIFQRFTQDEPSEQVTEPGTGIGLALVKELMELHHGKVELVNNPGKSCTFILWLLQGKSHFKQHQLVEPLSNQSKLKESVQKSNKKSNFQDNNYSDKTTLLVVDDNDDLREFISSRLSGSYRILQACNGQEGLAIAQTWLPDLIISDVMMPIMNGIKMTKKLKSNQLTKSIPVILLTAKSSKRETVTGLQSGADDYLTKPFDTSELITRVNGLINSRKLIREIIKSEFSQQNAQLNKSGNFAEKLRSEILLQLSNPQLSSESLAKAMAMSRHSLNRKCKNEFNLTTGQLITDIRMQHALSLLKLKQYSISEIAYGTGYDSLNYFSRKFKQHFDKTPSEIL